MIRSSRVLEQGPDRPPRRAIEVAASGFQTDCFGRTAETPRDRYGRVTLLHPQKSEAHVPSTLDVNVPALKERVTNILKSPKTEWPVIEAEPTTTEALYRGYIGPLAAIPAVSWFIGMCLVGMPMPFIGWYREGIVRGFSNMVVMFVLSLVGVYLAALVIDKLAPTFQSRSNQLQALKLVAYAQTPAWIAGVLYIIPALAPIAIVAGLYAIYLFYLGLPVMMKTPEGKVIPYMVVAAIVVIAVSFVVGLVSAAITGVARF